MVSFRLLIHIFFLIIRNKAQIHPQTYEQLLYEPLLGFGSIWTTDLPDSKTFTGILLFQLWLVLLGNFTGNETLKFKSLKTSAFLMTT